MLRGLELAYDRLLVGLAVIAGVYLVWIMGAIVFQATARTLGFSGSSHIFTFTEYGLFYITMLGAPWLLRENGHVFIELVTASVPDKAKPLVSRFIALLCFAICVVFTWYSGETTVKHFLRDSRDMRSLDMPMWLLTGFMPLCFGLMAVQFLRFIFGERLMHSGQAGVHE